jgi:hypothetical protein
MNISIEISDADGHEPMRTYVRKYTMSMPENIGAYAIGRRVKQAIGWRGRRSTIVVDGRTIKIYSPDPSEICLITFDEGEIEWLKEMPGAS